MKYSLVLSGASTKIFLHVGAVKAIYNKKIKINKFVGSSSGAIIAAIIANGLNINELKYILFNDIDFNEIIRENRFFYSGIVSLLWNGYLSTGKVLERQLQSILKDITFREIKEDLYIIAFNLTLRKPQIFCYELTPDIKVVDAVIASASLPILFPPKKINGNLYIDGGIAKQLPIDIPFIGRNIIAHLVIDSQKGLVKINGFIDYFSEIFDILISGMPEESILDSEFMGNNQYIARSYYNINLFDFNISQQQKKDMYNIGYHSMIKELTNNNIKEI